MDGHRRGSGPFDTVGARLVWLLWNRGPVALLEMSIAVVMGVWVIGF